MGLKPLHMQENRPNDFRLGTNGGSRWGGGASVPSRSSEPSPLWGTALAAGGGDSQARPLSGEPLEELQGGVADLAPAAVNRQRVATVRNRFDLGYARVALLLVVGGAGDRPGDRVVLLAVDD